MCLATWADSGFKAKITLLNLVYADTIQFDTNAVST